MRPCRLEMVNFGPFRHEVVSFTELNHDHVFLISGDTGAGKSTIFDAMTLALFNTTSGVRDPKEMRSTFAGQEGDLTAVVFTFEHHGVTYRISREIEQWRKGRKTPYAATVDFAIIDGVGGKELKNLGTKHGDVGAAVYEILGMNSDQFKQIIMLPQNEFRKLLVSPSREKQVILQKLAHTEIYRVIEEKLKEQQQALKVDIDKLQEEKMKNVQRVFPEITEEITANEIKRLFAEQKSTYKTTVKTLEEGLSVIERKIDNTQKDYYIIEAQLKEWNDLDVLAEDIAQLNEVVNDYLEMEEKIKFAKKALSLKHFDVLNTEILRQNKEASEEVRRLEAEIATVNQAFTETEVALAAHEEGLQEQKEREASYIRISEWEQKIKNLTEDYQLLAEFTEEVSVLEKEQEEKLAQVAKVKVSKEMFAQEDEKIRQAKLQEKDDESTMLRTQQEYNEFKQEQKHLEERAKIQASLSVVNKDLQAIIADAGIVKEEINQMEENQKSYQAQSLAKNLEEGDKCPVCGSEHHPQLAFVEGAEVETEHLEQKRTALQALELRKQELQLESERMLGQLEQLPTNIRNLEAVNGELERLKKVMDRITEQQGEIKKVVGQESNVMDKIAWINLELNSLDQAIKATQETLMDKKGMVQQKQARIDMLTLEIPNKYRDLEVYYQELATLKAEKESYEEQHTALRTKFTQLSSDLQEKKAAYNNAIIVEKNTIAHVEKSENEYEEAILEAGFASRAAYEAIKMTQDEIDQQEQDIQLFKQNVYHKTQKYEELKLRLEGKEQPDISMTAEKLKNLQNQLQGDIATISMTTVQLEQLEMVADEYAQALDEIERVETHYMEVGELAQSAIGNNQRNVAFERYVLGAFLDTILAHANVILAQMTGGRFLLERKDDKAKHNAQSGLDLLVFDEYTGTRRDVTSLSGGESFKASLALALALAEVVQEQSGGISLDTMFIDEGFGTLDPESLDLAVEALLETQKNGRLVGIISHVPELKARITAALQVTMTNTGSKTDIYIGGIKQ